MVRINIINPKRLTDQHLIAEYNEILMLIAYIKKYPLKEGEIPEEYCLGRGHMKFFKNKVGYLKGRHETISKEMRNRGFKTNKKVVTKGISKKAMNKWKPTIKDKEIIIKRITEKIMKKPEWYKYYGKKRDLKNFLKKLKNND